MNIGIIGVGGAVQGIHVPGFRLLPDVNLAAACDLNPEAAAKAGATRTYYDWMQLLADPLLDAVVVSTPNYVHPEIVKAAFEAGKHVLCEKPLALDRHSAKEMLAAAEASGKVHMTEFTYRYTPSIQYLRHLVATGAVGEVRTVRASYLMALSGHLIGWRSEKRLAGSGVLADIGSHLMHLVEWVAGEIGSVTARQKKFRIDPTSDVEDWISFLGEFKSGAVGTFEASRVCAGRGAGITEDMFIEIYGSSGSACFSLQDPTGLMVSVGQDARNPAKPMMHLDVPAEFLRLKGSIRDVEQHDKRWGYRYDQAFQFVESIRTGVSNAPSFADGVRCQAVLDAVLDSAASGRWTEVDN
jgi:predicted dehydrogenase